MRLHARNTRALEALHKRFRDRGFAVLGFPCDQFGHQEPGDETEIAKFCSLTYDVSFPMFAKIEVNGPNAHPLYKALKQEAPGLLGTEAIKWNFTKFLLDRKHNVVRRYAPIDKPEIARASTSRRCCSRSPPDAPEATRRGVVARVELQNGSERAYSKSVTHVRAA